MNHTSLPIVAAIDIGTTKICAIIAKKNEYGKIEILGVGKANSPGVTRGVISNIDKTVFAIEEAVRSRTQIGYIGQKRVCGHCRATHQKYASQRLLDARPQ